METAQPDSPPEDVGYDWYIWMSKRDVDEPTKLPPPPIATYPVAQVVVAVLSAELFADVEEAIYRERFNVSTFVTPDEATESAPLSCGPVGVDVPTHRRKLLAVPEATVSVELGAFAMSLSHEAEEDTVTVGAVELSVK